MLKFDLAPKSYYLLTVRGRKTGNPHSVPVALVEEGKDKWLVAPYGEVDWVRNARAARRIRLSRGNVTENMIIRELPTESSMAILKKYLKRYPITSPYFNAHEDSNVGDFELDAKEKPVFELSIENTSEPENT